MKTHMETCTDNTDLVPLCGRKIKQHLLTTRVRENVTCAACRKIFEQQSTGQMAAAAFYFAQAKRHVQEYKIEYVSSQHFGKVHTTEMIRNLCNLAANELVRHYLSNQ
jgi:hypothetical protein